MIEQDLSTDANLETPKAGEGGDLIDFAFLRDQQSSDVDLSAIRTLLGRYTASMQACAPEEFEALLLNLEFPFASAKKFTDSLTQGQPADTRRYQEFRASIFDSGVRYSQRSFKVDIRMDHVLAQVSLDFVTTTSSGGAGRCG